MWEIASRFLLIIPIRKVFKIKAEVKELLYGISLSLPK